MDDAARKHYLASGEHSRLASSTGRLEFLRSQEIIQRLLPSSARTILDVGGGTGPYAFWLADLGYEVHLVDAMPNHIETAMKDPRAPRLASATVGDALALAFEPESADAVLLMGPLYHLTDAAHRQMALREAHRVLKPGGTFFGAVISKYASLFDGYFSGLIDDPVFQSIVAQDLVDGQHSNATEHPSYFTTAKFHDHDELRSEVLEAGFDSVRVFGVEGFGWLLPDLEDRLNNNLLLQHLRRIEEEEALVGISAHLLAVARKPLVAQFPL